jgi:predicted RNA-binding protein with PIN domain
LDDPSARKKILHLIRKYQETKNSNLIIVFDGGPDSVLTPEPAGPKVSVVFPGFGSSADDEIKKILDGYSDYRSVTLITSDRDLKSFAKDRGAKTVNSIEFYFELKRVYRINGAKEEKLKRIHSKLSEQEVDQWLKIFKKD